MISARFKYGISRMRNGEAKNQIKTFSALYKNLQNQAAVTSYKAPLHFSPVLNSNKDHPLKLQN
jgi:hypothetical protein